MGVLSFGWAVSFIHHYCPPRVKTLIKFPLDDDGCYPFRLCAERSSNIDYTRKSFQKRGGMPKSPHLLRSYCSGGGPSHSQSHHHVLSAQTIMMIGMVTESRKTCWAAEIWSSCESSVWKVLIAWMKVMFSAGIWRCSYSEGCWWYVVWTGDKVVSILWDVSIDTALGYQNQNLIFLDQDGGRRGFYVFT